MKDSVKRAHLPEMFVGAGEVLEDGEALGVDQLHRAVLINAG